MDEFRRILHGSGPRGRPERDQLLERLEDLLVELLDAGFVPPAALLDLAERARTTR